jgi:HAD superfamily hydrolase (TIGR01509 family)
MIKAVVFDMDGVLLDTERVMKKAWYRAGEELGFKDAKLASNLAMGRNSEGVRLLFAETFPEVDFVEFNRRYHTYMEKDLLENGVPIKDGVVEMMQFLKENGYKIAVATSTSSQKAIPQLKEVKIADYFDIIMTGDTVKKGKPDPEIYLTACEKLGVKPESAYAVEDSPNGIKSAFNAGMKTVFIPDLADMPDDYDEFVNYTFDSMTKFREFLMNL